MTEGTTTLFSRLSTTLPKYLVAGLVAGLAAAVLNNIIYVIMIGIGGYGWVLMIAVSILVASFLPNLLAAIAYYVIAMFLPYPRVILAMGVAVFVAISVLPHLGIGPAPSPALAALPEGFDLVTVPLHLVFGLTAIVMIPWWVARE